MNWYWRCRKAWDENVQLRAQRDEARNALAKVRIELAREVDENQGEDP